jgi:uncharacterized protein DUF1837
MSPYANKPVRFFDPVYEEQSGKSRIYCAGFELGQWRTKPMATHLVEWLPDYALAEEELRFHHGNAYVKLQEAAVRVYTTRNHERRGEAGEIALHAICREFFDTIPVAPRVFYKSASNDPIKSFDLVHARFPTASEFEIWLGEAKFYNDGSNAITDAIASIKKHVDQGFLTREKLLLGPQISKTMPRYGDIMRVFQAQTSIDDFLKAAVFVVGILSESPAVAAATIKNDAYISSVVAELEQIAARLQSAEFSAPLRIVLVYVPLAAKSALADEFDRLLKGLQ